MAHMIPEKPRFHTNADHEDRIFSALRDRLPEEYTVIHSFHSIRREGKLIADCQSDFLVFHPEKGFLSIEAKYGEQIKYERGEWFFDESIKETKFFDSWSYGNNNEVTMHPFEQADRASKELRKYISQKYPDIAKKTKFTFAVWFHGMDRNEILQHSTPEHFEPSLLLTKDDLLNPKDKIESIFSLDFFREQKTITLTKAEQKKVISEIIDPSFVAISKRNNIDVELDFIELLEKQQIALNFLKNEKSVTVIGGAGTGKTVLAKQQAKEFSNQGENVLLLCYNWMLCEEIQKEFESDNNVQVMTVDTFALWMCKQSDEQTITFKNEFEKKQRYHQAAGLIGDMYGKTDDKGLQVPFSHLGKTFKHIIIDEAQDLGKTDIEDSNLIENLQLVVLEGSDDGSFVAFYDSLQNIQSASYGTEPNLPALIKNSFCRIPLKTNCRNTFEIDSVAKRPYLLKNIIKERLYKSSILNEVTGKKPIFYICKNPDNTALLNALDSILDNLIKVEKINKEDIAILSLLTEEKSFLYDKLKKRANSSHYKYFYKDILVSSCRKFKGCERKAIILIDFTQDVFADETSINMFYVGATRAILNLSILSNISKEAAHNILCENMEIDEKHINGDERKAMCEILEGLCKAI